MAEQLKQNDNKIAYVVSSGQSHRKVYQNGSSYVLKSYSKTEIKVDITALTTNASSKSAYTGIIKEYRVTSSLNAKTDSSGKTLATSYSTTSHETFFTRQSTLISSISSSSRVGSSLKKTSYFTYSSTYIYVSVLDITSTTQYYSTSLSEYNNQSYTTFTTNRRYTGTVPSYNVSNTYPYISFTTTGNFWKIRLGDYGDYDYYYDASVPNYGTLSSEIKGCRITGTNGEVGTYASIKKYLNTYSHTTTFTSYVSSTTY